MDTAPPSAQFICPVTVREMNGKASFVFLEEM